jgi:lysophospholipase L1-like esterase
MMVNGVYRNINTSEYLSLQQFFNGYNILAFGDSLTYGLYVSDGKVGHHSYAVQLNSLLNISTSRVIESGVSGEVTKRMISRLQQQLPESKSKIVIILGGTNDIGHQLPIDSIINNIYSLHQTVHKSAAILNTTIYTVAVTIPPVRGWKGVPEQTRLKINKAIREFAHNTSSLVALQELENVFVSSNSTNNLKYFSPDMVHFSKLGYDEIGSMLFFTIKNFILSKQK